jgi:hypothetical protein
VTAAAASAVAAAAADCHRQQQQQQQHQPRQRQQQPRSLRAPAHDAPTPGGRAVHWSVDQLKGQLQTMFELAKGISGQEARAGAGASPRCTAAHPLYTGFVHIFGGSFSETPVRPGPIGALGGVPSADRGLRGGPREG